MKHLVITGGCGFVGSSLAIQFKNLLPSLKISVIDNLKRRGSELNISRLKDRNISFVHGDIRSPEDIKQVGEFDCMIECSAEPSVLAGFNSSPEYLVNTNLFGTFNCLEAARNQNAKFIFISTSRVYPYSLLSQASLIEKEERFSFSEEQSVPGLSSSGVSEDFPLVGPKSLYGATKLCSELLIMEYVHMYGLQAIVNRCGVLAGPWQFGKVDQGVVVLWMAKHFWRQKLNYIGFNGSGKQVRDILHIDDLFRLLVLQMEKIDVLNGEIFNVGGGEFNLSLLEMTKICEKISGNSIEINKIVENRPADIAVYKSDCRKVKNATGWKPTVKPEQILIEIYNWIKKNESNLEHILK